MQADHSPVVGLDMVFYHNTQFVLIFVLFLPAKVHHICKYQYKYTEKVGQVYNGFSWPIYKGESSFGIFSDHPRHFFIRFINQPNSYTNTDMQGLLHLIQPGVDSNRRLAIHRNTMWTFIAHLKHVTGNIFRTAHTRKKNKLLTFHPPILCQMKHAKCWKLLCRNHSDNSLPARFTLYNRTLSNMF